MPQPKGKTGNPQAEDVDYSDVTRKADLKVVRIRSHKIFVTGYPN